jgi:hypothetical protein
LKEDYNSSPRKKLVTGYSFPNFSCIEAVGDRPAHSV